MIFLLMSTCTIVFSLKVPHMTQIHTWVCVAVSCCTLPLVAAHIWKTWTWNCCKLFHKNARIEIYVCGHDKYKTENKLNKTHIPWYSLEICLQIKCVIEFSSKFSMTSTYNLSHCYLIRSHMWLTGIWWCLMVARQTQSDVRVRSSCFHFTKMKVVTHEPVWSVLILGYMVFSHMI